MKSAAFLLLPLLAGGAQPGVLAAKDSSWRRSGVVDLLKLIDPARDTVEGTWTLEKGVLVCAEKRSWARLQIPYIPPDEYDLTIVAERVEGLEAINIGLVRGEAQFHSVVDGWKATMSGLSTVDGKWANRNETTRRGQLLKNGRSSVVVCSVRKEGVSMTVDGNLIFDWKGDYSRLGNIRPLTVPYRRALYINSFYCVYRFSKMTLKPVSGRGKRLMRGVGRGEARPPPDNSLYRCRCGKTKIVPPSGSVPLC